MSGQMVVFSSWGPGNFATVLEFCDGAPEWHVGLLVSDRDDTPSVRLARDRGLPVFVHPVAGRLRPDNPGSLAARAAALRPVTERLHALEQSAGRIDLIVLAFHKILAGGLLETFGGRMINVHPADLSVFDLETRRPRYVGISGLARAITDGNTATRTSVHRVTPGVDEGPLICLGPEVAFEGDRTCRADIDAHEIRQKHLSDRPCLMRALALCCGPPRAATQLPSIM